MSYPIWLTPPGNLGTVPEAEYFQLQFDAYDTSAGQLKFFRLSGTLPPGLQITQAGSLQGIPVSTGGPDLEQSYTFTVRIQNLSTLNIADRTFTLSVSNISPPIIIPPPASELGQYFDGSLVNISLFATEDIAGGNLVWSLKSGTLPPGLTVSTNGVISGIISLLPIYNPLSAVPGWDSSNWDAQFSFANAVGFLGWEFFLQRAAKSFEFTIQVTDGGYTSTKEYKILVLPRRGYTADTTYITADDTIIDGRPLTADIGSRHFPIILSAEDNVPPQRQGSWFSFKFEALDLDGDDLTYFIPNLTAGTFDEQVVVGNIGQPPYIGRSFVSGANISVGIAELGNIVPSLYIGNTIQVLNPFYDFITESNSYAWYDATINSHGKIRLTGNTIITANIGDFMHQTVNIANATVYANATITSVTPTTGNILFAGQTLLATIFISGELFNANIGDTLTQVGSSGNATVITDYRLSGLVEATYDSGEFLTSAGNLIVNGTTSNSFPVSISTSLNYAYLPANIGDIVTQTTTGANAVVINSHGSSNTQVKNALLLEVEFMNGQFAVGETAGNIQINGSNIRIWPTSVYTNADIGFIYNSQHFVLNQSGNSLVFIDERNSFATPTKFLEVGVNVVGVPNDQGIYGFDEIKFDQGVLSLPGALTLNPQSGWLTGYLPTQTANETVYNWELQVYKTAFPEYQSNKLFSITVLGDLYNTVEWITPSYLGSITNGAISDLSLKARSPGGKNLYYYYTPGTYINMVQGLRLLPSGLISGRVSFELFSLDTGTTTFDLNPVTQIVTTTFDHTFEFSVTASTYDQTASATRRFSILVKTRNVRPYENLYLRAQLNKYQRIEYNNILRNRSVFPEELIYRSGDPWFGIARDIKTLFLPGLNPSDFTTWRNAMAKNHFVKRILFTEVKTAVAREDGVYDVYKVDDREVIGTFNVYTQLFIPKRFDIGYEIQSNSIPLGTAIGDQTIKYEVVYAEIKDQNTNSQGLGPEDEINLSGIITVPYYDASGNAFVIANPNSFPNMENRIVNNIGYQDQGVLPEWMTSIQPNGQQIGFIRAAVLAYTIPGAADTIAWRFKKLNFDLNEINYVVDQYYLDNVYSSNFNLTTNAFFQSSETTFDRYPPLTSNFNKIGTVDYAVNLAFQQINERKVSEIVAVGGLDGIVDFKNGQKLVFNTQEFNFGISIVDTYNQGWARNNNLWDDLLLGSAKWDASGVTGWDSAGYLPGFREWGASRETVNSVDGNVNLYSVFNERIGIYTININDQGYVRLSLANVSIETVATTSNTTGFGSNVSVTSTEGLFVGMPIRGAGLASNAVITDIVTGNIVVFPAATGIVSNPWTAVPTPSFNDSLFVRNGFTSGGAFIYYDPIIKFDKTVPNYSKIPQQIRSRATTFDGDGTKFYDFRDNYVIPGQGEQQIKFPRTNIFT